MKYTWVSFFAGCLFLSVACKNHQQPVTASTNTPATDTATDKFLPIADYLESEIRYVDSTPLAILKLETIRQRKDSSFLTPNEFNRLASLFLTPELRPDSLEKNFNESSFSDKTTGALTFSYSPKDKEQPLQRIDVTVSPNPTGSNKVKSIYIQRVERVSDTMVVKKMLWQAGRSFEVVTSLQPRGKTADSRQLEVIWNNGEQ